jgi:hypothetical protein
LEKVIKKYIRIYAVRKTEKNKVNLWLTYKVDITKMNGQLNSTSTYQKMLSKLSVVDARKMTPTKEDFDAVVELGNTPVAVVWKNQYDFHLTELMAIRSCTPDILNFIDSWSEYSGPYGFNPILEEVAKVRNMYYLQKFWSYLEYGPNDDGTVDEVEPYKIVRKEWLRDVPPEFVRMGWSEGVTYLLNLREGRVDSYENYVQTIMTAINEKKWDLLRIELSALSEQELVKFLSAMNRQDFNIDYTNEELKLVVGDFSRD